jgi:hypothetical protein
MTGSIAQQVWREFSPREDEEVAFHEDFRDNGLIMVTIGDSAEGFDMDPETPFGSLVSAWQTGCRRSSWKRGSRWFQVAVLIYTLRSSVWKNTKCLSAGVRWRRSVVRPARWR